MVVFPRFYLFFFILVQIVFGSYYCEKMFLQLTSNQVLAANSQIPEYKLLPEEVRQMPVWEILKTLHLHEPFDSSELKILGFGEVSGNAHSVILEYTGSTKAFGITHPSKGLQIVIEEMFPSLRKSYRIELLFNEKGYLIGIFPEAELIKEDTVHGREWFYFDLSAFYLNIADLKDPQAAQKWARFAQQWKKDQETIDAFIRLNGLDERKLKSVDGVKNPYSLEREGKKPFLYVEVTKEPQTGDRDVFIKGFKPNEYSSSLFKTDSSKHQIIIPVFPTVYSPYRWKHEDIDYMNAIYFGIPAVFQIPEDSRILVMGPGCGIDLWLAWLKTKIEIHTAGINMLEVANARVTARLAGIPLVARAHNNLVSPDESVVFRGDTFDILIWNMPSYSTKILPTILFKRSQFWDRYFNYEDLARFFKGFPLKLKQGGKALLWNQRTFEQALVHRGYEFWSVKLVNQLSLFVVTNRQTDTPVFPDSDTRRLKLVNSSL